MLGSMGEGRKNKENKPEPNRGFVLEFCRMKNSDKETNEPKTKKKRKERQSFVDVADGFKDSFPNPVTCVFVEKFRPLNNPL